ncbi:MAG: hypothetical protein GQ574_18985 [Crocinitomix sp.]|nr:hypothetical protein [Crocinitomix sp.]
MKHLLLIPFFFLVSCFPSMQTGPDPHSIEFDEAKFQSIVSYFLANPEAIGFDTEDAPDTVPVSIIEEMEVVGFLEFRNLHQHKVFFCGYGVVGKGWGFIYGEFSKEEIKKPSLIQGNGNRLHLTYLEHLEGGWFRFAV